MIRKSDKEISKIKISENKETKKVKKSEDKKLKEEIVEEKVNKVIEEDESLEDKINSVEERISEGELANFINAKNKNTSVSLGKRNILPSEKTTFLERELAEETSFSNSSEKSSDAGYLAGFGQTNGEKKYQSYDANPVQIKIRKPEEITAEWKNPLRKMEFQSISSENMNFQKPQYETYMNNVKIMSEEEMRDSAKNPNKLKEFKFEEKKMNYYTTK